MGVVRVLLLSLKIPPVGVTGRLGRGAFKI